MNLFLQIGHVKVLFAACTLVKFSSIFTSEAAISFLIALLSWLGMPFCMPSRYAKEVMHYIEQSTAYLTARINQKEMGNIQSNSIL